jgi:FkbM family methyltransferase
MSLQQSLAHRFPFLGPYKRLIVAVRHSLEKRPSYSQHGEDRRIVALLEGFNFDQGRYIDVGANHPTDISNTYLLYRSGWSGIIIEPNPEFVRLFRLFRPRDTVLAIGCGELPSVERFIISKTPVLSSFVTLADGGEPWKELSVPVLSLDTVVAGLKPGWVPFLNVDAEGFTLAVLRGADATLQCTYLVCAEADAGSSEEAEIHTLLENAGFGMFERIGCNILAINKSADRFQAFTKR